MRTPFFSAYPLNVMVSLSTMKVRSSPFDSLSGSLPDQEISSSDPQDSFYSPEIVPDPSRSPGFMLHPVTV